MGHALVFGLPSAIVSFAIFRMLGLPHPTIATLLAKYDADVKSARESDEGRMDGRARKQNGEERGAIRCPWQKPGERLNTGTLHADE